MIYVAIGSNLPGLDGSAPLTTCRRAAAALDRPGVCGLRLAGVSRWYRTTPILAGGPRGAEAQPDYINGVAQLQGGPVDPAALLAALLAIEAREGRIRGAVDAARTLDLDIIAMGDLVRDVPDPVLPHPRAHLRAFVLAPLIDLAPGWVHPRLGRTAESLLAALPPQGIEAL